MDDHEVFCHWEEARFPRVDFDDVEGRGLVHTRSLKAGVPRHTAMGDRVDPPTSIGGGGGGGTMYRSPMAPFPPDLWTYPRRRRGTPS
jgi:hypothetical protein